MTRREPVRLRMRVDIWHSHWLRVMDEQPKHAAAARQVTDPLVFGRLDAAREEALQVRLRRIEDAERGVLSLGHVGRDIEQPCEYTLEVELGHERPAGLDQLVESILAQLGHMRSLLRRHEAVVECIAN